MEKCVACQFYDRDDARLQDKGVRWGKCRRTGPIVNPVSAKSYMVEGVWPSVRDDDWCGEWAAHKGRLDGAAAGALSSALMHGAVASPARPMGAVPVSLMIATPAPAPNDAPPPTPAIRFGSD